MRASHDSRETLARVSHNVRANFDQFYLSQLSLEMVLFMLHRADCRNFLAMCLRTYAKGWRRVRNICNDLATVLRSFLAHKKVLHV